MDTVITELLRLMHDYQSGRLTRRDTAKKFFELAETAPIPYTLSAVLPPGPGTVGSCADREAPRSGERSGETTHSRVERLGLPRRADGPRG